MEKLDSYFHFIGGETEVKNLNVLKMAELEKKDEVFLTACPEFSDAQVIWMGKTPGIGDY